MHDVTARPLEGEAQRALGAVFKRLLDTAYATTHLGFTFTTYEQVYAEQLIAERFNAEAAKAGWDVRLEQLGPALPDVLYKWDGWNFEPAASDDVYVEERWRRLGRKTILGKDEIVAPFNAAETAKKLLKRRPASHSQSFSRPLRYPALKF